jgi:SulP family sulfate permease
VSSQAFRELDENPGDETFEGIAALRLDSGLFFATAEALDDRVRALIRDSEPRLHALVIDLEGVDFVDSQGAAKLAELYEVAKTDGVKLRLARVKPQVLDVLVADGMVATLGATASTETSIKQSRRNSPRTPGWAPRRSRNHVEFEPRTR